MVLWSKLRGPVVALSWFVRGPGVAPSWPCGQNFVDLWSPLRGPFVVLGSPLRGPVVKTSWPCGRPFVAPSWSCGQYFVVLGLPGKAWQPCPASTSLLRCLSCSSESKGFLRFSWISRCVQEYGSSVGWGLYGVY